MTDSLISEGHNSKTGDIPTVNPGGASRDCVSQSLGLCQVQGKCLCYGKKLENFRRNLLLRNRMEGDLWANLPGPVLRRWIQEFFSRQKKTRPDIVRFSVYGDFPDQSRVDKFLTVAANLPKILFYGYTARSDLDWSARPRNVVVSGSAFMLDNEFRAVPTIPKRTRALVCHGNCMTCGDSVGQGHCMKPDRKLILVAYH